MSLDKAQLEAIKHFQGPMMVLAGPGSGKTTVITYRVKYLIEEYKVDPSSILVITFTKAAATEMRERFDRLTKGQYKNVRFSTFHSVFFTILKLSYGYTVDSIAKEEDRIRFMKDYVRRLGIEYEDENEFVMNTLGEISMVKNAGLEIQHYYSNNHGEDLFRTLYNGYEEFLRSNNLIDFDDMLLYTRDLFAAREDILKAWQRKYSYVLIDEFQDINRIQYDNIRMMAAPENNLFIVGDDDQSIYRFRGSKPEIMLGFKKDYPETKEVLLGINYRSKKDIVDAASNLISYNRIRYDKKLLPATEERGEVKYLNFKTQREENAYFIKAIQQHIKDGKELNDIAVLVRTNLQPGLLVQMLVEKGIPFRSRDRIPNIYNHWIAEDIYAYIRIALGSSKRADFIRVMNKPKRYLSRESLPSEKVTFDAWKEYYDGKEWMCQRLEKFSQDLDVILRMRPFSALNYIRIGIGYNDYLKEYAQERHMNLEELEDILDEIQDNSRAFNTFDEWFNYIDNYSLILQEKNRVQNEINDAVTIMTLHSAKGLEFDTVYIFDVDDGVMPYKKAVLESELEEERRMFYVGLTRAKNSLYICSTDKIRSKEMNVSNFIIETKRKK